MLSTLKLFLCAQFSELFSVSCHALRVGIVSAYRLISSEPLAGFRSFPGYSEAREKEETKADEAFRRRR